MRKPRASNNPDAAGKKLLGPKTLWPMVAFLVVVGLLVVSLRFTDHPAVLEEISPTIADPGDVLVLTGRNFGDARQGGVTIAGKRPTSSSYIEWSDDKIRVRIPEDVSSGMVFVTTRRGSSKGLLFTSRNQIPVVVSETRKPGDAMIDDVVPRKGHVGTVIAISGLDFGLSRGSGKVLFTPVNVSGAVATETEPDLLACSELDYDYESWTDQLIRVRVPDGATTGNIYVSTDRGRSNAAYFEVTGQAGSKIFGDRQGYQIEQNVRVTNVIADSPNSLDLWVPGVLLLPEQRNIDATRTPEPLWHEYLGLSRYHFVDVGSVVTYKVSQVFWLDRFAVETRISSSKVLRNYDTDSRLYRVFTAPDILVPSDDPGVVGAAASAVGRERNPYLKARMIYYYLLKRLVYTESPEGASVLENLIAAQADSYTFSVLFCAFARSVGVPARPVSGFLIYETRRARTHHWGEFFLPNFGWVPVDPALGDGASFDGLPPVEAPQDYYFGNLDAQHVTFSKGITPVEPSSPETRPIRLEQSYSLQGLHEEITTTVRSYSSRWDPVSVIDRW